VPVSYTVRGRIPDLLLPRAGGAPPSPLRGRPREAVVLVFPRNAPPWRDYLRRLAAEARAFGDWDGRAVAVPPDDDPAWDDVAAELGEDLWVLRDEGDVLRTGEDRPAVVVADRYGEIYRVWRVQDEAGSPGPEPRDLEEWLQFLALQCPE
jgi:hypothetical protein